MAVPRPITIAITAGLFGLLGLAVISVCLNHGQRPPPEEPPPNLRPPPVVEPLRIATIDLNSVFARYHRTGEAESDINRQKAEAKQDLDRRNARYRQLISQYQDLGERIENPETTEETRSVLRERARRIASEARGIEREKKEVSGRRQRDLLEEVDRARDTLMAEICELVDTHARMWNYDLVLDRSGAGVSGTPYILYSGGETIDITEDILATLNLDVPVGSR